MFDPNQYDFSGSFDDQVKFIFAHIRLSRDEAKGFSNLLKELEHQLQSRWRGCKVTPFGSLVTGLATKTSDVDCYVHIPNGNVIPKNCVYAAKTVLERNNHFQEIFAIPGAKVPIVKFYYTPTQTHCDVNFSSFNGVRNSSLIAYLLHMDKRALPLAILIKYWAKLYNLTGTNLMPNYTLTILVIFFLQQKQILPSVHILQWETEEMLVDNWDSAFDENFIHITQNREPLYRLLGEFFEFYSTFDYSVYIISTYLGCPIEKKVYQQLENVPNVFMLYKQLVANGVCQPLRLDTKLCVQDPFEHSKNIAAAIYPRLGDSIIALIKNAAQIYKNCSDKEFLKNILTMPVPNEAKFKRNKNMNETINNKNIATKPKLNNSNVKPKNLIGVQKNKNKVKHKTNYYCVRRDGNVRHNNFRNKAR